MTNRLVARSLAQESVLWRRIDQPGHEAARLLPHDAGWHLTGTAVFGHDAQACCLEYLVACDGAWRTISAAVSGWVGSTSITCDVAVDSARRWHLNGRERSEMAGCLDIDLAFSPSTNLLPIRRLNLPVGQAGSVRAAWLRFPDLTLEPLDQVYRRLDQTTYRYESGGGAFSAILRTNAAGFVMSYPGLWEGVDLGPAA